VQQYTEEHDKMINYLYKKHYRGWLGPALVVQNIVLAKLAKDTAVNDVYGGGEHLYFEFMAKTDERGETHLMTGAELFSAIYEAEKTRLERELYQRLKKVPKEDLHRLSEKALDIIRRFSFTPRFSWQGIKEQLQAEGDDVT
jgi:hypothetical protein